MEQTSQRTQLRCSTQSRDPENTKFDIIKHLHLSQDENNQNKKQYQVINTLS